MDTRMRDVEDVDWRNLDVLDMSHISPYETFENADLVERMLRADGLLEPQTEAAVAALRAWNPAQLPEAMRQLTSWTLTGNYDIPRQRVDEYRAAYLTPGLVTVLLHIALTNDPHRANMALYMIGWLCFGYEPAIRIFGTRCLELLTVPAPVLAIHTRNGVRQQFRQNDLETRRNMIVYFCEYDDLFAMLVNQPEIFRVINLVRPRRDDGPLIRSWGKLLHAADDITIATLDMIVDLC